MLLKRFLCFACALACGTILHADGIAAVPCGALLEGAKAGMLPESIEKEKAIGKLQRANFRKAYLAGAPLLAVQN
jgi:hypothetical protein